MCHCSEKFSWVQSMFWFILWGGGITALKPPVQGPETTPPTTGWSLLATLLSRQGKHGLPPWLILIIFISDVLYRDKWRDGAAACVIGGVLVIPGTATNWTQSCSVPVLLSHYRGAVFPLLFQKLFSRPSVFPLPPSQKGANFLNCVLSLSSSSIHKLAWLHL